MIAIPPFITDNKL